MGRLSIAEATFENLPALELSDAAMRLTVLPQWGGKVAEMLDLRRSREWLYKSPALPYRLPVYDASYVRDFDVGGFDECFPTIGACLYPAAPWRGTPLPDHGEVWSLPWAARIDGQALHLTAHGVRLPYRFEKSIRLLGNGRARFDYRAANLTPFPMPFLWSSHPLFAARPGMRLTLPVTRVRAQSAPAFAAHHGEVIPWPLAGDLDLSLIPQPAAGLAVKLFTPVLDAGWAELSDPSDGAAFRFDFNPALVTHLGLWLNYGGWAGAPGAEPYFNLAIEPCIGAPDALDTAFEHWREYAVLPPNGSLDWWLEMTLS